MKKLLLFLLIIFIFGCKKDNKISGLIYPKTVLPGTTWKAYNSTPAIGSPIYEFIHFNNPTSVTITFADINENNGTSTTASCIIHLDGERNMDSFEVDFPSGKDYVGFTTDNTNQITFDGTTYDKVN